MSLKFNLFYKHHFASLMIKTMLLCVLLILAIPWNSYSGTNTKHGPSIPDDINVHRNLDYMGNNNPRQTLDLYLPVNDEKAKAVVIWLHAGAFRKGSKGKGGIARILLNEGYAIASVNYRLSQEAIFPAQIIDTKAAVCFLRANAKKYALDPNHIGVWGKSAGGYLAALLGVSGDQKQWHAKQCLIHSSRVQAVCDWFGPTDFLLMNKQAGKNSTINHDAKNSPESLLMGAPIQSIPELVTQANPLTYASPDDAPFLIMHGEQDSSISYRQSEALHMALLQANVVSELEIIAGAAHGGKPFHDPDRLQRIISFFNTHLRPAQ